MLDPLRAKARFIGIIAAAFIGGVLLASGMEWTTGIRASSLRSVPAPQDVQALADLSDSFISISESVTPAVVSIRTERMSVPGRTGLPDRIPEEFRDLFNVPPAGEPRPISSGGTGFIIREDGHILTNNHVVADASVITVVTMDRREYTAELIGRDPMTDVAVIKIEGDDFPHVRIGDPNATRVGEWVVAIGNPLGLDFTVTAGIVSAKNRSIDIIQENISDPAQRGLAVESFIQTDAAINPGNSGGPLVNTRGQVIGINTAIASNDGTNAGYGFAVPIDLASQVAEDIIRYGRWRRAVLGVSIDEVVIEDFEAFDLPYVGGALIQDFGANSLAERAGLRRGDVIIGVDGEEVSHVNELQRLIAKHHPGDRVTVEIVRMGDRREIEIQLVESASAPVPATAPPPIVREAAVLNRIGADVVDLTPEIAQGLGYPQAGGVVLGDVSRYGPLGERFMGSGFRVNGFRLVSVDGTEITSTEQFQRVIQSKAAGSVVSLVLMDTAGTPRITNVRLRD